METLTIEISEERAEALRAMKVCARDSAKLLGKSPQSLHRRVKRKQLSNVGTDGKFLFRLYDILLLSGNIKPKI